MAVRNKEITKSLPRVRATWESADLNAKGPVRSALSLKEEEDKVAGKLSGETASCVSAGVHGLQHVFDAFFV
jgi:broad specificity polyphosphatase/5'/3'-nucleotidase SurE